MDVEQRHEAAERSKAVVHAIDGAAAGIRGDGGKQRGTRDPEAHFLAFHVAARLADEAAVSTPMFR